MPPRYRSSSIRLPWGDYSQAGWYFGTICTQDRRCVLGEIVEEEVVLSPASLVVEEKWRASEEIIVNKEKKLVVEIVPITAFKNERTLGGGKEIV